MYETIMHLPLFKGFTSEQVSTFLEKNKLEFANYSSGATLLSEKEDIERIGFIISGELDLSTELMNGKIRINRRLGQYFWLLPEYLLGYSTCPCTRVEAHGKTGMLWFGKEQFLRIIDGNYLCKINFLNYLCYQAQSRYQIARSLTSGTSFERWLTVLLMSAVERRASNIQIHIAPQQLARVLKIDEAALQADVIRLTRQRKIKYTNGILTVLNRREFF